MSVAEEDAEIKAMKRMEVFLLAFSAGVSNGSP